MAPRLLLTLSALFALAGPAASEVAIAPDLALTGTGTTRASVRLPAGEDLAVALPAQAGTGYAWSATIDGPDLLAARAADCPATHGNGRVGGAARACFGWTAIRPGATRLRFGYRRPWEEDAPEALRFDLDVTVAPAD